MQLNVYDIINDVFFEQTDNQELMQRRESPERDDDMQREALQTLSRLVRDKDLEIQALTQKNHTLLQVLQV